MSDIDSTAAQYYALRGSNQQSGFEDLEPVKGAPYTCGSFEHNPPMGLYVPIGKRYRHVCPQCGMTQYINSMEVYC